jgi:hypothetical protein
MKLLNRYVNILKFLRYKYSSYTNYFGNLLTQEQKRELLNEFIVDFDLNQNPYMLKKNGNKNYNDNMKNLSNYSFGGVSPLKIMKTSQSLAHVANQSIQRPKSAIVTE